MSMLKTGMTPTSFSVPERQNPGFKTSQQPALTSCSVFVPSVCSVVCSFKAVPMLAVCSPWTFVDLVVLVFLTCTLYLSSIIKPLFSLCPSPAFGSSRCLLHRQPWSKVLSAAMGQHQTAGSISSTLNVSITCNSHVTFSLHLVQN